MTLESTNLRPEQLAGAFGFRAAVAGKTLADNPHLQPGENPRWPNGELANAWHYGWLEGQGKREADVGYYLMGLRGNG